MFFWRSPRLAVELSTICAGWRTLTPHEGDDRIACYVYVEAPARPLRSMPFAVSGSGHTRRLFNSKLPSMRKSVYQAVLSNMPHTPHVTLPILRGASCLVQATSAWSMMPRRASSRHYRDARGCGHTTAAIHDMSTPPPRRAESEKGSVGNVLFF